MQTISLFAQPAENWEREFLQSVRQEILQEYFPCTSDPWDQSCRCCWIATCDPNEPKSDPNRKGLLSVVSHVETDKKADETTFHVVFDVQCVINAICEQNCALIEIISGQFMCEKCLKELRGKSGDTICQKRNPDNRLSIDLLRP